MASQLDPTLAEPYAALGVAYDQRNHYLEGRAAMERALSLDPDDITTNFWAGVEYIGNGYTAKGTAQLDRVLAIDPLPPNALLWRGIEYVHAGNLDRAQVLLQRAADVGLAHVGVGLNELSAARGQSAEAAKQLLAGMRVLGAGFPAGSLPLLADGVYGDAAAKSKALASIDEFMATKPKDMPGVVTYTLLLMHEDRRVLALLSQYGSSNGAWYFHRMWSPNGRTLRALPEFVDFARHIGWTALWDKYGSPDACRRVALGDYDCRGEAGAKQP